MGGGDFLITIENLHKERREMKSEYLMENMSLSSIEKFKKCDSQHICIVKIYFLKGIKYIFLYYASFNEIWMGPGKLSLNSIDDYI